MGVSIKESKGSSSQYLALVLGVPALLLTAAFAAANTKWFLYHDDYFLLRNVGYSLTLHHADCKVVLTGDSSALTGLDPRTVSSLTGLSACNVAEGGTITAVVGSYPLDAYLQQNTPPKYIVFMFSPSLFRPSRSWRDYGSYYEGIVYALRYESNWSTYRKLLAHPYETLNFSAWAAHGIIADAMTRIVNPRKYDGLEDPFARRQKRNGLFTFYSGPETSCFRNGWDKSRSVATDPEWIAGLRKKYGVNGTRVFVDVAPVADCDDMTNVYERDLKGVHDNPLEVLPIRMFNNQDVHFTIEGAERVSTTVANQIVEAEEAADHDW